LLDRAARWLRPGGTLVYSVCSLETTEGEAQLRSFLDRNGDYRVAAPDPGELPDFVVPAADGTIRTLPGLLADEGGCDGFFIARLVRTA
jgi:16S rRNA (cytosine967-C5)-methyltransferase